MPLPTFRIALAAAIMTASLSPALAGDGKQLFADKGCTACHGEDAVTPLEPGYPRLAGQNADYLFNQMKDIKSGARANSLSAETMKPILDEVSEDEMRVLADYLTGLTNPALTATPAAGTGKQLYLTRTCVACHGKEGKKPIMKTYPVLAGQDMRYAINQITDIKTSARKNGATNAMQTVMHLVSDAEIAEIAAYLSSAK
ncbi:MAG: c-type cytochrome [Bacteroidota bacterium]